MHKGSRGIFVRSLLRTASNRMAYACRRGRVGCKGWGQSNLDKHNSAESPPVVIQRAIWRSRASFRLVRLREYVSVYFGSSALIVGANSIIGCASRHMRSKVRLEFRSGGRLADHDQVVVLRVLAARAEVRRPHAFIRVGRRWSPGCDH